MRIGVPKERLANETRVAATPKTVEQLLKLGFTVAVESGAGKLASFDDEAFIQAGAEVVDSAEVWQSPVILKVNAPEESEIALLNPGTTLESFIFSMTFASSSVSTSGWALSMVGKKVSSSGCSVPPILITPRA